MPVEIREIEIKATVTDETPNKSDHEAGDTTEEITQEVIERVLQILKSQKEL